MQAFLEAVATHCRFSAHANQYFTQCAGQKNGSLPFRAVSSHRLVPGDVVVVLRGKVTCDLVLLQGSCLVEESMLSGEVCTSSSLCAHKTSRGIPGRAVTLQ